MSDKPVARAVEFADHADTDGEKYYKTVTAFRDGRKVIVVR